MIRRKRYCPVCGFEMEKAKGKTGKWLCPNTTEECRLISCRFCRDTTYDLVFEGIGLLNLSFNGVEWK